MNDDSPSHFPATAPYEAPPEYWAIAPAPGGRTAPAPSSSVGPEFGWPLIERLAEAPPGEQTDRQVAWVVGPLLDEWGPEVVLTLWWAGQSGSGTVPGEEWSRLGQRLLSAAAQVPGISVDADHGTVRVVPLIGRLLTRHVAAALPAWTHDALDALEEVVLDEPDLALRLVADLRDRAFLASFLDRYTEDVVVGADPGPLRTWVEALPPDWCRDLPQVQRVLTMLTFAEGRMKRSVRSPVEPRAQPIEPLRLPVTSAERPSPTALVNELFVAVQDGHDGRIGRSLRRLEELSVHDGSIPMLEIGRRSMHAYLHWRTGEVQRGDDVLAPLPALLEASGLAQAAVMFGATSTLALREAHLGDDEATRQRIDLAEQQLGQITELDSALHLAARLMLCEALLLLGDSAEATDQLELAKGIGARLEPGRFSLLRRHLADLERSLDRLVRRLDESTSLTRAETRTLRLLASHMSVPQIAEALTLSPSTIRTQTRHIFRKLGVASRAEAVARAAESGLL